MELDPDNASINGNYAIFLTGIRKDYDQAEVYYRKALELNPDDAAVNGNYAIFLTGIRKDHDQAEVYYRKALELDPDDAAANDSYAIFLTDIRKDHDQAEVYYRKALELDPDNANINGNYAGFLIGRMRISEAKNFFDKAESLVNLDTGGALLLELAYYRLVLFPENEEVERKNIDELLENGHRSIGWDFSEIIARAKEEEGRNIELLQKIADRISSTD